MEKNLVQHYIDEWAEDKFKYQNSILDILSNPNIVLTEEIIDKLYDSIKWVNIPTLFCEAVSSNPNINYSLAKYVCSILKSNTEKYFEYMSYFLKSPKITLEDILQHKKEINIFFQKNLLEMKKK